MKNYHEMYEKIENPLNDDEVIRKLIEGYSDELRTKQYYNKLIQVNYKEKKYKEINMEDKDRLVSQIFNDWKKDLTLNIKDDEIKKYNKDFPYLREFLKNTPYVKSAKEFFKINRKVDGDEKLEIIYPKYTPFSHGKSWTYISHNSINPSKYKKIIVDHRLYLNTENIDTYKVMELFRNKCKERELDYHFKFSDRGDRDDTIVIYSDDRKLSKYLEILEEIKKEEPEIVKRAQTPPMLTGKIDGWIGYGSEPSLDENGKNTKSFNSSRSGIIQNAISKETIKWLRENKELTKEDLGLNEYLTKQISDDIKDKDKYRMDKSFDEPEFQEKLLKRLEKEIEKNKSELLEGKFDKIKEFNIDGLDIEVDSEMIQRAFRPFSKKILKKDPSFLGKVRDAIKEEGLANGIDSEKFCFDIDKREKLFNEDKTNEILETIDPEFLNKKIKFAGFLKGYDEIEYERYIRAVVNELPKDKNIIMKDGRQLTPKQFIENEIPKLEQKYNINIKKLLEENIVIEKGKEEKTNVNKNNIEQKSTPYYNSKKEEYNEDILKNINKDVLNKKVQVGEGREITYKEYLEKYVMHKMPKGEKIKLKNGIEIPTKQYIEEVLLQEKSKYGLDVESMLADTIKDYTKEDTEKIKSTNTNNISNNTNYMNFKDKAIEEARISYDSFKDNKDKEQVKNRKFKKVLLETEKTNLPMKIGFFEKIKDSFKKLKELAHKVKVWIEEKKLAFNSKNTKVEEVEKVEVKEKEKETKQEIESNKAQEEQEKNEIINEPKELENNEKIEYSKTTRNEILENDAVKEKIEEYMKQLDEKVKGASSKNKEEQEIGRE
jgi:PREDICTED: rCG54054-like